MIDPIQYQIKFPLEQVELEILAEHLYYDFEALKAGQYVLDNSKDLIIGINLLTPARKKYEMDLLRNKIDGYIRKKPYQVKANKLQILWLYTYIDTKQINRLYHLSTNILGKHITEYTR